MNKYTRLLPPQFGTQNHDEILCHGIVYLCKCMRDMRFFVQTPASTSLVPCTQLQCLEFAALLLSPSSVKNKDLLEFLRGRCSSTLVVGPAEKIAAAVGQTYTKNAVEPATDSITWHLLPAEKMSFKMELLFALVAEWLICGEVWHNATLEDCKYLPHDFSFMLADRDLLYEVKVQPEAVDIFAEHALTVTLHSARAVLQTKQALPHLKVSLFKSPYVSYRPTQSLSMCARVSMPPQLISLSAAVALLHHIKSARSVDSAELDVLSLASLTNALCLKSTLSPNQLAACRSSSSACSRLLALCRGSLAEVPAELQVAFTKVPPCSAGAATGLDAVKLEMAQLEFEVLPLTKVASHLFVRQVIRVGLSSAGIGFPQMPCGGVDGELMPPDIRGNGIPTYAALACRSGNLLRRCKKPSQVVHHLLMIWHGLGHHLLIQDEMCKPSVAAFGGISKFLDFLRLESLLLGLSAECRLGALEILSDRILIGRHALRPLMMHAHVRMQEAYKTRVAFDMLALAHELVFMQKLGADASVSESESARALSYWIADCIVGCIGNSSAPGPEKCNDRDCTGAKILYSSAALDSVASAVVLPPCFASLQHFIIVQALLPLIRNGTFDFLQISKHEAAVYSVREALFMLLTQAADYNTHEKIQIHAEVFSAVLDFVWLFSEKVLSGTIFSVPLGQLDQEAQTLYHFIKNFFTENAHMLCSLKWFVQLYKLDLRANTQVATPRVLDRIGALSKTKRSVADRDSCCCDSDDDQAASTLQSINTYNSRLSNYARSQRYVVECDITRAAPEAPTLARISAATERHSALSFDRASQTPASYCVPFAQISTKGTAVVLYDTARACYVRKTELLRPVSRNLRTHTSSEFVDSLLPAQKRRATPDKVSATTAGAVASSSSGALSATPVQLNDEIPVENDSDDSDDVDVDFDDDHAANNNSGGGNTATATTAVNNSDEKSNSVSSKSASHTSENRKHQRVTIQCMKVEMLQFCTSVLCNAVLLQQLTQDASPLLLAHALPVLQAFLFSFQKSHKRSQFTGNVKRPDMKYLKEALDLQLNVVSNMSTQDLKSVHDFDEENLRCEANVEPLHSTEMNDNELQHIVEFCAFLNCFSNTYAFSDFAQLMKYYTDSAEIRGSTFAQILAFQPPMIGIFNKQCQEVFYGNHLAVFNYQNSTDIDKVTRHFQAVRNCAIALSALQDSVVDKPQFADNAVLRTLFETANGQIGMWNSSV